ncbi:family 43 glycosylhydrolase [Cohnella sp. GbtcB17]|uniref:family 43 glycosylhydrolase n=1 Tax=Cohnella sp. GbtcB17 TaxID=2824762 RepID=UPI001C2FA75D|nr:family 43 glycosylhydrolase [Cohnella sp. GbtcB17]
MTAMAHAAHNPMLPLTAFVPDGEPHVFEYEGKKRLFVYGSRDERVTAFCGFGHDAWSAPVDDLSQWTNHGEIFNVKQVFDIGYGIVEDQHFGAPDCAYNPVTGKYYLYTFLGAPYALDGVQGPARHADGTVPGYGDSGPKCVMAISDSPAGPFTDPVMCDWPAANAAGAFDPSVLVDEQADGSVRVYAFWGMHHAGEPGDRCAELDPHDMHTIIDGASGKPDRHAWRKTLPAAQDHNGSMLFEASSIKKISGGHYVFIYSALERISALTYCYSDHPMGPWTYGGQIVNNDRNWPGGNNHGSIVEVNGQWYVVYHRRTCDDYNRQAMMEPIEVIAQDGRVSIPEVEMTSQGISREGLLAFRRYPANLLCYCTGNVYIDGAQRSEDGLNPVRGIDAENTVIGYKYFQFGTTRADDSDGLELRLNLRILSNANVTVQVALPDDADDPLKRIDIASFELKDYRSATDDYLDICVSLNGLDRNERLRSIGGLLGKLFVALRFDRLAGEACTLREIEFAKSVAATPNPLQAIKLEANAHGRLAVLPTHGRGGESVKVSVFPETGYKVVAVMVKDALNRSLPVEQNGAAPYAPVSFHFRMPSSEVKISAAFARIEG